MSIYTPYTYLIGWSSLNKFYYGRRTKKGCNPTDLWTKYFTSSKVVKEYRKLYGEPDIIQIRQTFCDAKKCAQWECKVLERINAQHNPKYLNQRSGDYKWDTTGRPLSKDSLYKRIQTQNNEYIILTPENKIVITNHLRKFCEDHNLSKDSVFGVIAHRTRHNNLYQIRKINDTTPFYSREELMINPKKGKGNPFFIKNSKTGETYYFTSLRECEFIDSGNLSRLVNGKVKQVKGWTLYQESTSF